VIIAEKQKGKRLAGEMAGGVSSCLSSSSCCRISVIFFGDYVLQQEKRDGVVTI
jgi:hypothetical protein